MAEVDADIWILTETHVDHRPSEAHEHVAFSPPHPERRPEYERWTAVWSRYPLAAEGVEPHRRGTVAVLVDSPIGEVLVYGTVIAWANEPRFDNGDPARMWQVHLAEIDRQAAEWQRLRAAYPNVPLIVAGDFNQDRDGSGWYGTRAGRDRLTEGLAAANLTCLTDADLVTDGTLTRPLIDHICTTTDLVQPGRPSCWERTDESGQRLSDHPTVAVDFHPMPVGGRA